MPSKAMLNSWFFVFLFFSSAVPGDDHQAETIGRLVPWPMFPGEEEIISVLDYSHCSLQQVPKEALTLNGH